MGLDTTHDCWHGPYSAFMAWRIWLHGLIEGDARLATRAALDAAWCHGRYDDQSKPLNVLMNHSDCEGEIPADLCLPLAEALSALLERAMDQAWAFRLSGWLGAAGWSPLELRAATQQFIAGLRRAAADGEPVRFE